MANHLRGMPLSSWRRTRDTLQGFAQVIGAVRQAMTPAQRHWFHISLRASAAGLMTPPIPNGPELFDLELDFTKHVARLRTSRGRGTEWDLQKMSVGEFAAALIRQLAAIDIRPSFDAGAFAHIETEYDTEKVGIFLTNLQQIDMALQKFKGTLPGATGPVQIWPHHFDLALLWFSGRLVPGVDPQDEESAEEQMNFGFSTGDDGIPDPYFYVTAYPFPEGLDKTFLPAGAVWNSTWKGSVLMFDELLKSESPDDFLMTYWMTLYEAGRACMQGRKIEEAAS